MGEEEIASGVDISETGTPVEISLFEPAERSGYIPREGFYPDAEIQLSAGPKPNLPLPELSPLPLDSANQELERLWREIHDYRVDLARMWTDGRGPSGYSGESLPYYAFAPDTEVLFDEVLTPVIKAHCKKNDAQNLLVDDVGYPLPFWFKDELEPIQILEGKRTDEAEDGKYKTQLQKCIAEGAVLPKDVGVVYLDFPSTVDTVTDTNDLFTFIHANPNTLFVVDQANQYFDHVYYNFVTDLTQRLPRRAPDSDLANRLGDTDNVFIINTSTKSGGTSGCAALQGTQTALDLASETLGNTEPQALGFTDSSFLRARQALTNEITPPFEDPRTWDAAREANVAVKFRDTVNKNKTELAKELRETFGEEVVPPKSKLHVTGPHIFVDATQMGFENAQELCDYLYEEHSIATKPASVYTNTDKHPEFLNYTYISIPTNESDLQKLLQAFSDRKDALEKST